MLDQGCYGLDTEVIVEGLKSLVDELSAIVSYYCVWHAKPTHDTSPHKVLHVLGGVRCEWLGLDLFGEIIDSD